MSNRNLKNKRTFDVYLIKSCKNCGDVAEVVFLESWVTESWFRDRKLHFFCLGCYETFINNQYCDYKDLLTDKCFKKINVWW